MSDETPKTWSPNPNYDTPPWLQRMDHEETRGRPCTNGENTYPTDLSILSLAELERLLLTVEDEMRKAEFKSRRRFQLLQLRQNLRTSPASSDSSLSPGWASTPPPPRLASSASSDYSSSTLAHSSSAHTPNTSPSPHALTTATAFFVPSIAPQVAAPASTGCSSPTSPPRRSPPTDDITLMGTPPPLSLRTQSG